MMADLGRKTGAARINLAETANFDLGGLCVCPAHREVRMNGERRELEPRVAQVLVALASARPGVVSRDRLIEQCWDGRIVGDDALNRCIVALRHLAREFAPQPFEIETVPRVGYALIEGSPDAAAAQKRNHRRWLLALLAVALIVAALAFAWPSLRSNDTAPVSMAVLPFRNLSNADPYFAEGVSEEISGQLAREPQFRVAGRTSSSQFGTDPDIREVARRLDVDYVLDGSVRTQGDRVRVTAALVRTSDGIRLWSDIYEAKLDDIFAIQQRIGIATAGALKGKLLWTAPLSGALVTNGEAYGLYLTARGLIRTYKRQDGETAARLLRDAIDLDPGYAPAWASLAAATRLAGAANGYDAFIAATPRAEGHARHALKLAPEFAEAHRTLGMLLGYGTPEAQKHLRRAAELAPDDAENMIWLGVAHNAAGEFEAELEASRKALQLDPYWFRTVVHGAVAEAEMGNRAEAEAIVRRGFPTSAIMRHLLLGRIAWIFGDFSEAAHRWSMVVRSGSPRWSDTARRNLNDAIVAVGLKGEPAAAVPPPNDQRRMAPVWMDAAPSPSLWKSRNRSRAAAQEYREANHKAAKLMLNAGRAGELAAAYGSATGLLSLQPGQRLRVDQLHEAPVVAVALHRAGRDSDADRLLRAAEALARATYRRGRVPFWFDADAAALWAVQEKRQEALAALERAMRRGWSHSANTDLRDISDEPAFRSLHGEPRFERIRQKLAAHRARERRETERLRI